MTEYVASVVSVFGAFLALLAYVHSKEKMRLELSKERFEALQEVYTLAFTTAIMLRGFHSWEAESKKEWLAKHESAIDKARIKGQLIKLLFDEAVWQKFAICINEITKSSELLFTGYMKGEGEFDGEGAAQSIHEKYEDFLNDVKPYVYFGGYKKKTLREKLERLKLTP